MPKIHRSGRTSEDHRAGLQVLLRGTREVNGVEWSLCDGDIASRVDECLELGVGDLVRLNPEAVDADPMGWRLLLIVLVGPHGVRLSRNPAQTVRLRWHDHTRGLRLAHVASAKTWSGRRSTTRACPPSRLLPAFGERSLELGHRLVDRETGRLLTGGNSLNVSRNCATTADAVITRMALS